MITCKCGHWYNTSIKCPECDTVAKLEEKDKLTFDKIIKQTIDRSHNAAIDLVKGLLKKYESGLEYIDCPILGQLGQLKRKEE